MLKSIIALALLANGTAAVAAADPPCLTQAEFRSVSLFMLPAAIQGTADRCQTHLSTDAYLLTGARRLADTVARDRETHRGAAIATLARLSGSKMPEGVSGETLASLVNDMLRTELVKNVKAADCARIDEAAALLAPLPVDNLVGLLGLLFREGVKKGNKKPPFYICAAQKI